MLTKKQVIDVLKNPFFYSKEDRKEAIKLGIDMLNKMAIADGAKEHTDAADNKNRCKFCEDTKEIATLNGPKPCPYCR